MKGKVAVVTGSNIGIGKETAVALASLGATTVLACRNQEKAKAAQADVVERSGHDDVHLVTLDLADLESVKAAASDILSRWDRLDVLVNNAGGVWTERHTTEQGFEQTVGVNHIGPFLLTNLLLARLKASAPSRIVNVSSVGHHMAFRGMRSTTCRASIAIQAWRPTVARSWQTSSSHASSPSGSRAPVSPPMPCTRGPCGVASAWTAT
ncbi:MAG: SDR family NAD(P)-dependent oxidoreductase [Acidimicrobiales bacterium]